MLGNFIKFYRRKYTNCVEKEKNKKTYKCSPLMNDMPNL